MLGEFEEDFESEAEIETRELRGMHRRQKPET
jgi:hypothetical protein